MRPGLAVLLPLALSCGCRGDALGPSRPIGPDTTATSAIRYEDYFFELAIEDAGTGQRGLFNELIGYRFSRKARLQLAYVARRPAMLDVAVVRRDSGELAGVWSAAVTPDSGVVPLASFPRDFYVLQAFVSRVRIAEIRFASE